MIYTLTNPGVKFIFSNSDFLLTICNMSEYFNILYDEWKTISSIILMLFLTMWRNGNVTCSNPLTQ